MLLQLLFVATVVSSQWPSWPQWGPWQACYPEEVCDDCPCDYGRCFWWGDPHTKTFDNMWHHFQGNAGQSYRYVTPCTSDFNLVPFQILTRHRSCGWPPLGLTCSDYVDIRLYDPFGVPLANFLTTIRIDNGLQVIDTTTMVNLLDGRYTIGNVYIVVTRHTWWVEVAVYTGLLCDYPNRMWRNLRPDFVVRANSWMGRVSVQLNEYYKNLVCGLCGFWSGTHHDDFTINGKTTPTDPLQCQHYDSSTPQSMWSYTAWDWNNTNNFGQFWQDRGLYVRRLQDSSWEDEASQITIPQLSNQWCLAQAQQACQSLVGNSDTALALCVDEVCGRLYNGCTSVTDCLKFFGDYFGFNDTNNLFNGQNPDLSNNYDRWQTVRGAE